MKKINFPKVKSELQDFLYEEEGNVSRSKIITVGTLVMMATILSTYEAFAKHHSHSSHVSHGSHVSHNDHGSHGSHSSHSAHSNHNSHSNNHSYHSNHVMHGSHSSHTSSIFEVPKDTATEAINNLRKYGTQKGSGLVNVTDDNIDKILGGRDIQTPPDTRGLNEN